MAALSVSRRTRSTPYSSRVEAAGLQAYTVYNHMLLPTVFRGLEEDYFHLRSAVQVWDVSCERQVELVGPDAARLAQFLTVRDLRSFTVGRCGYAPIVDHDGFLINDPVVLRLADDRFWFSVADSDVALWAGGIARTLDLDVRVHEPDVWPLGLQGPRSDDVAALVFGDAVRDIKFFRFASLDFRGHSFVVARSGWSAQGGFEIYVDVPERGVELYDALIEAGAPFGIGPGCPNQIERIEAGLLSYGNDVTRAVTRLVCGLTIAGDPVPGVREPWPVHAVGPRSSTSVGQVTSAVWSPRLRTIVALAMVDTERHGDPLVVDTTVGPRTASVVALPFPQ